MAMISLRHVFVAFVLSAAASFAQQPQKVVITKCADCSTKAGNFMKTCRAGKYSPVECQASYQKKMKHCAKSYCNAKTTTVKVKR